MSKPIKIAVIGAGRWGVHLVRNFHEHPQAKLVAVVDRNTQRLETVREQFKLDHNVVLATDWAQVRQLPDIKAVAIATPASTHYSLIADALEQGYHILAEKPLTLDPAECLELCQLAQQQQRQLIVDHTYLFHPAVERGKEVIQAGTLGELRYGYATRTHLGPIRQDVDALWDLAIHDICIFNTWLGETPVQGQAIGTIWLQRAGDQQSTTELFPQGLSDLVRVTLTYPSGFQAFIHLCWFNPDKQRRLCILGSQGTLIFDEMSASAPLTLHRGHVERTDNKCIPVLYDPDSVSFLPAEPLRRVCDHFLESVLHNHNQPQPSSFGESPISSGLVGAKLVQILTALSESMKNGGQPVTFQD